MKRGTVVGIVVIALTAIGLAGGIGASAATAAPSAGRWERVPFASTGFAPGTDIRSIVTYHGQLFAAGWTFSDERDGPNALWRSADGRRWTRVRPGQFGSTSVEELVATKAGLLTFGQPSSHDGRAPTTIWGSTDGTDWQPITTTAPWGIRTVVPAPVGLVAAGIDEASGCDTTPLACTSAAIWSSPDGRKWTKASGGASTFPRGDVVSVVHARNGLVAVGVRSGDLGKRRTATLVWSSPDGASWRRRPAGELGALAGSPGLLAARADRVLLVGEVRPTDPLPTTTTTAVEPPPTTLRTANGGLLTQSRICLVSSGVTGTWTTKDASTWVRNPTAPLDSVGVSAAVATHGRWLVAGYRGDCNSSRAILYSSTDGRRWHQTIADPKDINAVDPQTRMPLALAATPGGAIAAITPFGDLTSGPDVWIWTASARG